MNTDMVASIIESLQNEVRDSVSRYNFYVDFVNLLAKEEFDGFDDVSGIDQEFDSAVEEFYDMDDEVSEVEDLEF